MGGLLALGLARSSQLARAVRHLVAALLRRELAADQLLLERLLLLLQQLAQPLPALLKAGLPARLERLKALLGRILAQLLVRLGLPCRHGADVVVGLRRGESGWLCPGGREAGRAPGQGASDGQLDPQNGKTSSKSIDRAP
jgi:hypothetical protein